MEVKRNSFVNKIKVNEYTKSTKEHINHMLK